MALKLPFEDMTPESIKAEMLSDIETSGAGVDIREGSYANTLVSEAAYVMWKYATKLQGLVSVIFPAESLGEYLDYHAREVGLTRQPGAKATGTVTFNGTAGTTVPAGTVLITSDGRLRFRTTQACTLAVPAIPRTVYVGGAWIQLQAIADVPVEAEEIGQIYNVDRGEIVKLLNSIPRVLHVFNSDPITGGADVESDSDLYTRYHERLVLPITSGNAAHYVYWAKEVSGVSYARCEPLWNGPGTVRVIVGDAARGPLDAPTLAACAAHIEEEHPIGANVTVITVTRKAINAYAQVKLRSGYTLNQVRNQFTENIGKMLAALPFATAQSIPYSRFLSCLVSCEGVEDYSNLKVNGDVTPVILASTDAPWVNNVSLDAL